MPQMAPLSWLTLFIIFSLTLIFFSTLNYFNFQINQNNLILSKYFQKKNSMNWKW